MDDLEAAEAYRREAEFYKEKAEENIRYKYLYLRLGGEMYEVLEILRRTPCACAPLQEAESRLRQMLEQAIEKIGRFMMQIMAGRHQKASESR